MAIEKESNTSILFDEEYFERGLITGKSCYLNYRWMPELTIKMAYSLIKYLKIGEKDCVLDYGCAKGFLVKALKILDIDTYGCDISKYAIDHVDSDVRGFCQLIKDKNLIPFEYGFDWIITKDVFEHMTEDDLDDFLEQAKTKTNKCFCIIPLGDKKFDFIIPEYKFDSTHILSRPKEWWIEKFKIFGWKTTKFSYKVIGIKDNWTSKYPKGNGFFILHK